MPVGTPGRILAMAAIAVIVAAGLCVFDEGEAADRDLCLSLLGTTIGLLLASPLAPTGGLLPALAKAYYLSLPNLPAPPPKF